MRPMTSTWFSGHRWCNSCSLCRWWRLKGMNTRLRLSFTNRKKHTTNNYSHNDGNNEKTMKIRLWCKWQCGLKVRNIHYTRNNIKAKPKGIVSRKVVEQHEVSNLLLFLLFLAYETRTHSIYCGFLLRRNDCKRFLMTGLTCCCCPLGATAAPPELDELLPPLDVDCSRITFCCCCCWFVTILEAAAVDWWTAKANSDPPEEVWIRTGLAFWRCCAWWAWIAEKIACCCGAWPLPLELVTVLIVWPVMLVPATCARILAPVAVRAVEAVTTYFIMGTLVSSNIGLR